jgi:hypothetical protein
MVDGCLQKWAFNNRDLDIYAWTMWKGFRKTRRSKNQWLLLTHMEHSLEL